MSVRVEVEELVDWRGVEVCDSVGEWLRARGWVVGVALAIRSFGTWHERVSLGACAVSTVLYCTFCLRAQRFWPCCMNDEM